MSELNEPIAAEQEMPVPLTHRRILTVMTIVIAASAFAGFVFVSVQFGLGVLFGGVLSFVNYYWLKTSLGKVFENAVSGERQRFLGLRYASRYFVLGAILLIVFLTKTVPVVSVILGMASFALAITIEGFVRLFATFFNKREI